MGFRFFSKKSEVIDLTRNKIKKEPEVAVAVAAEPAESAEQQAQQESESGFVSESIVEKKEKSAVDRIFEKFSNIEQRIGLLELKVDRLERKADIIKTDGGNI